MSKSEQKGSALDIGQCLVSRADPSVSYLMKRYVAVTNRQIGELFGGMSGFAVAKAYQRIAMDLKTDASLEKEIGWFERAMSRVKG